MNLPIIIVNPTSGAGATREAWPGIASDLASQLGAFKPLFTTMPGQAIEFAAEAARQGADLIVACGGDGTISEVANGILLSGRNAELGIMPSGTGGDLRKTLGISGRSRDAAEILCKGHSRLIDVGRVTFVGENGTETRFFLGVASFGMSADVIEEVKRGGNKWLPAKTPRWLSGRMTFGMSMLKTTLRSSSMRVRLQLDDAHESNLTVTNLCIANARYFGGGMKIAPDAKLNDGKFDVITIGDLGALRILSNSPRIYLGAHLSMNGVDHALASKVIARPIGDAEVKLEVDGELPGNLPASFQIVPRALRVRCGH